MFFRQIKKGKISLGGFCLQSAKLKSAAAAITTILIIGGIVVEIAIAALVASYFASQTGLGSKLSYSALFLAQSGVDDAFIKITRDKDWSPNPDTYSVVIGDSTAQVTVCKDKITVTTKCDTAASTGTYEVTSLGSSVNKQVKMKAVLYVDPTTGLVNIKSLEEIGI